MGVYIKYIKTESFRQAQTMASSSRTAILPQSKEALLKSYNARLKDDVRSMLENFEGNKVLVCYL